MRGRGVPSGSARHVGKRSLQRILLDAEYHFRHLVGEDSFRGQLSQVRDRLFRAQLILHDQIQAVFLRSLELAREKGLLQGQALRLVLDTTPDPGTGCGQGHLQSAGRRHSPTVAHPGPGAGAGRGALGRAGGLRPLPGTQPQGEYRGGLGRPRGAARVPGDDRGRCRAVAGLGPDLAPSDRPRAPGPTAAYGGSRASVQAAVAGH